MKLSAEQQHAFDERGYVFFPFPNCFSEDEIAHRDFTPADDSLLEYARAHRVAAE